MYTILDTSSDEACSVNSVGGFRGCIADYLHVLVLGHMHTAVGLHGPLPAGLIASNYGYQAGG